MTAKTSTTGYERPGMTALLQVQDLSCSLGARQVLRGVGFQLQRGEVLGLIGPNGAGKSTLLRCLLGLQRVSHGGIVLNGRALANYGRSELARTLAYVPQPKGAGMALSVADVVALGRLPHRGLSSAAQDAEVVLDAIEAMALAPLALRSVAELSGGERQRVLIARALAQQTPLLLFDEPTSDLDLQHQLAAMQRVRALADERGASAVIALHDLGLAARFCHRLLLLDGGRVRACGAWPEVLTTAHLSAAYQVQVRVGTDAGVPYVIPLRPSADPLSAVPFARPSGESRHAHA